MAQTVGSKRKYQLVALDIDRTLLTSTGTLTPDNRNVILKLGQLGVHVVLATGKSYLVVSELVSNLSLTSPQITNDGSIILLPSTSEIIYRMCVPRKEAIDAIRIANDIRITLVLVREDGLFVRALNDDIEYMSTFGDPPPSVVKNLEDCLDPLPTHLMAIAYKKDTLFESARLRFREELKGRLNVVTSAPYYIQLVHPKVSKGNALKIVAQKLHIPNRQIIAVGDGENDISMMVYAGFAVAMGNARAEIKAYADYVTDTCDNSGVAKALQMLF